MTFGPKHEGCRRQFIQLSRAHYGKLILSRENEGRWGSDLIDEINIGFYHREGGTTGEFCIEWFELAGKITPRLMVFNDAWDALWQFRDVLEKMAAVDGHNITPDAFCELLKSCGVEDATPVEAPV